MMRRWSLTLTVLLGVLALAAASVQADIFHLTSGGTIEGQLMQRADGKLLIAVGSGTVTLTEAMVARIEEAPPPIEQYRKRAAEVEQGEQTAAAHLKLARWCEDKHLSRQARQHYEKVILLDPDNASARARLGYVRDGERWLSREEVAEARQAERQADKKEARDYNYRYRSKKWEEQFRQMDKGPFSQWTYSEEFLTARTEVLKVKDPAAVEPLVEVFARRDDRAKRLMAVEALAGIGGDEAAVALVDILAADPDEAVAQQARQALAGIDSPQADLGMKNLLRGGNAQARDRAAAALGDKGDKAMDAVPYLIRSLITREEKIIHHEPIKAQRAWIADGTHYAYVADLEPVVAEAAVGWNPVIGYLVSGVVLDVNAIFEPWQEHIWVTVRHTDALDALRRITGQDFGFDIRAWQRWYFHDYLPNKPAPANAAP